jgi:CRISPR-associated protein Cmr5
MQTIAQKDLTLAIKLVTEVSTEEKKDKREAYGRLCHSFPVMVRTCGLCQAVAFSAAKAADGQGGALKYGHETILAHGAAILGTPGGGGGLAAHIASVPVETYMDYTNRLLRSWIYFKRLAVSMLEVSDASGETGGAA